MKNNKENLIDRVIKESIKPFIYEKYGKIYIGYKETEGALRYEGFVLHLEQTLQKELKSIAEDVIGEEIKLLENTDIINEPVVAFQNHQNMGKMLKRQELITYFQSIGINI